MNSFLLLTKSNISLTSSQKLDKSKIIDYVENKNLKKSALALRYFIKFLNYITEILETFTKH